MVPPVDPLRRAPQVRGLPECFDAMWKRVSRKKQERRVSLAVGLQEAVDDPAEIGVILDHAPDLFD
jgi:hypothetical protein